MDVYKGRYSTSIGQSSCEMNCQQSAHYCQYINRLYCCKLMKLTDLSLSQCGQVFLSLQHMTRQMVEEWGGNFEILCSEWFSPKHSGSSNSRPLRNVQQERQRKFSYCIYWWYTVEWSKEKLWRFSEGVQSYFAEFLGPLCWWCV